MKEQVFFIIKYRSNKEFKRKIRKSKRIANQVGCDSTLQLITKK
jgi:hypothetical protein